MQALAIKYRPKTWNDVTEQSAVRVILNNQIQNNEVKHAYLFTGPAGTGKTTCARIFANEINHGEGTPIELDAASNNSVDDIRNIIDQAQTMSLDGNYKVFILDEVHSLSNQAWQAFLKTLEEPPVKAIFIMCTTDPQKIPATILSRAQRYNFQKISTQGIVARLDDILNNERDENDAHDIEAIEYIAKLADGGMRDAITLLDKCLAYSKDITVENVVKALGVADYDTMFNLYSVISVINAEKTVEILNTVYNNGIDIKRFIKSFFEFVLDISIYHVTNDISQTKLPNIYIDELNKIKDIQLLFRVLDMVTELNYKLRYEQSPRSYVLATFILFLEELK